MSFENISKHFFRAWISIQNGLDRSFDLGYLKELSTITFKQSFIFNQENRNMGLPWWLNGKDSAYSIEEAGLISGSGRFP